MTHHYETLEIEAIDAAILRVTLNRPEVGNAMNTQMGRDLLDFWTSLVANPDAARCVVLTGAGARAFCAGGDLKQRQGMSDADWRAQHLVFERGRDALVACPVPVIAAVNGAAYGGGLELALTCDFAYAATTARFALTEVTLGIMPGAGGTQFLPRAAGERRAKEIILTGQAFGADEALAWGIVNRVCAPDALMEAALATARVIAANAPLSVRQAKKSIHHGLQMDLTRGTQFEIEAYDRLIGTEDRREGVQAFNEKRKPRYQGR